MVCQKFYCNGAQEKQKFKKIALSNAKAVNCKHLGYQLARLAKRIFFSTPGPWTNFLVLFFSFTKPLILHSSSKIVRVFSTQT